MFRKFLVLFFLLAFANANAAITVVDDTHKPITLSQPAERIISLAPDLTEILFALGIGSKVVGVIAGSDFPLQAQHITIVGSHSGLDIEKILLLRPDLIVVWGETFSQQLQTLAQLGIPIYRNTPRRLEDVPKAMLNLGLLTGSSMKAQEQAKNFYARLNKIKSSTDVVRVFFQIGTYSFLTINKQSWINQAITLCGGKNIFSEVLAVTPRVDMEAIIQENPEVIVTDTRTADWQTRWQKWQQIAAVKNKMLFNIETDWIDRAGPRLILGVEKMCEFLHKAKNQRKS